jgi:hypothetical protein
LDQVQRKTVYNLINQGNAFRNSIPPTVPSFFPTAAQQASVSIKNACLYKRLTEQNRLKHGFKIAQWIQLILLSPIMPQIKGIDIAGSSPVPQPNYFDYLNGIPDAIMVIVGDISYQG